MNTAVYIPTGLSSPELEILLAKAQASIDSGAITLVISCSGGSGYACSLNIYGLSSICHVCKAMTHRGLQKLHGTFAHLETPPCIEPPGDTLERSRLFQSRWSLKSYYFKGVDVGQAAYSSYLGLSRDQDLEGYLSASALNKLLSTSEELVSWFENILIDYSIKHVILYNGRHNHYRPLLRVAQKSKLQLEVMEFSGLDARCVYTFDGTLPHDISALTAYIERTWDEYTGNIAQIVDFYYQKKRGGGIINDTRSYILDQVKGRLPQGWDPLKHNIAIFNSSEDEYTALGGDYDQTLYSNQAEAIAQICNSLHLDRDILIWLRIHPNLSAVRWAFVKQLYALGRKYHNVRIIAANSPVCSYSLLDACDTVLTFGSTMGVEAVYFNKPSILVGRCIYERLGCVYTPSTHKEVISLLRLRNLPPLSSLGAFKVALFWAVGGHPLPFFGGDRKIGFTFAGHSIVKTPNEWIVYSLAKLFEKIVLSLMMNSGLRKRHALFNR